MFEIYINIRAESDQMRSKTSWKKWVGGFLILSIGLLKWGGLGHAEVAHMGIDLSNGEKPIELYSDSLEIHEKKGIAIFNDNVSIVQGERLLQTSKLVVYYDQDHQTVGINEVSKKSRLFVGSGLTGVKKMEALGNVYIKIATQIITGDKGIFDGKSNVVTLTGNVVLKDGRNVATGCKLTTNMKTGKALLEGCEASEKKSRVSIILQSNQKSGH